MRIFKPNILIILEITWIISVVALQDENNEIISKFDKWKPAKKQISNQCSYGEDCKNDDPTILLNIESTYYDDYGSNSLKDYDTSENYISEHLAILKKRNRPDPHSCDCQLKTEIIDLGFAHFPRYLVNAVCAQENKSYYFRKCRRGYFCKPVEYKVRVLAYRKKRDILEKELDKRMLPDSLRSHWRFKVITVAAGCFCSLRSASG